MAYFRFLKTNSGMTPAPRIGIAGGAIAKGDLLAVELDSGASTGKVIKALGDNSGLYEGVALHAAAAEDDAILYMPLDPDYDFEGTVKDATNPKAGDLAGIDVTSTVQKIEAAGTVKVCVVKEILNATGKLARISFLAKGRSTT